MTVRPAASIGPTTLGLVLLLVFASGPVQAQSETASGAANETPEAEARTAAQEWLRFVDGGAWRASWTAAAPVLRDAIDPEQWVERVQQARGPLGTVHSRLLTRSHRHEAVEQAPDAGPIVQLRYRSVLGGGLYVETVSVVQADEGWRVAGYEVAPVVSAATQEAGSD